MLPLSLRMLARDWRAGELRILALALVVAVASVTSVGFFSDRVRQALTREAHQLLGADLLLHADHPWRREVREEIARRGLALAENVTFISMARRGELAQLASVKAVSRGYPLRGKLRVAPMLNAPDADTDAVPAPGSVWVDERMAIALGAAVGETIELGKARLTVAAIVTLEPDRGVSFFNLAPRLMMHVDDIPATGLVQTGSRISYALLAAGESKAVAAFEAWAEPQLGRGESLQSLSNARPEIRASLDRAQKFIGLTAMLAVILAGVSVSLATRRYSLRHLDGYAVMRCFGATQSRLFALFAAEFGALGVIACALGCIAGYFAQFVIAGFVAGLMAVPLPQPSLLPALQGFAIGIVLLLGFALPPLLQLKDVPALRVIRREVGPPRQSALIAYAAGFATIGALLIWQAGEIRLGLIVVGGFALAIVVFGTVAFGALALISRGAGAASLAWRHGLANLARRAKTNTVQIVALSLGLTAILLLTFTRGDLLDTWRSKLPADAPNRFIINIQPEQRAPLLGFFRDNGIALPAVYSMVRGRYVARNDAPIDAAQFDQRSRRMVEREFNLSSMEALPEHNHIVAGRQFNAEDRGRGALSVEEGIAQSLGWKIGDRLSWQVAGQTFTAPIVSIRKLDWDSMRVNFFVIATPGLLANAPTSFITSFHLPAAQTAFTNRLSQRYPNVTVVDMSAILQQVQGMMEQVIRAVQFVFLFALGAGILVLYSALLATQDERMQEAAVMRALGATRAQVLASQRAEFIALGLIAGALAAAGSTAIGYAIAVFVFQFAYQVNTWIWIVGPALGLACVAINAIAGARSALRRPPILALREL
ncbi:MAG: ABC transporter permease [Betaproteobacteria bacterium RBG_16_64_18]|nr:MAG: ABC transporter permease [Betaproteobacteria bacterium RBG_16_64_18]